MNLFRKQFQRSAFSTALLISLLSVGMAFCAIGIAAWVTVWEQLQTMKSQYTTVAIPAEEDGFIITCESIFGVEEEYVWTPLTKQKEHKYPGLLSEDARGFLAAHVLGCQSVSPYERDYFSSELFDTYNKSMMVLAVRCESVTDLTDPNLLSQSITYEDGEIAGVEECYIKNYAVEFTLEEAVCRFPGYDGIPDEVRIDIFSSLYTEDGEIPFESGKTYLLFGVDRGISIQYEGESEEIGGVTHYYNPEELLVETLATDQNAGMGISSAGYSVSTGNQFFSWHGMEDGEGGHYYTLNEDSLPFCAEYAGDWREFLQSGEGMIWREEIIPWCQLNYECVSVILTDKIDSLYLFNQGDAGILDGRKFQEEEYAAGDAVCMVGAAYAKKNGLSVGDTINLDLYQSDLNYQMEYAYDSSSAMEYTYDPIWVQEPCASKNRLGVQKDYTIVGIYTALEFQPGWQNFQADTIFIPKASVPNAEKYEDNHKVLLYSVILENEMEEEFEAYISEMGFGGQFVYSDQGYHAALESFGALEENALRLAVTGGGAFLLTAALFLFLAFRQMKHNIFRVRLLGMEQRTVRREVLRASAGLVLLGTLAGAGLGCVLYKMVTERALEDAFSMQPLMIVLCAAGQAVLLLIAAWICAVVMTSRGLMDGSGRLDGEGRGLVDGGGRRFKKGLIGKSSDLKGVNQAWQAGRKKSGEENIRPDYIKSNHVRWMKLENSREKRKPCRKFEVGLWRLSLVAMWRRKKTSLLFITVAAASIFFAVFVQRLAERQEMAIGQMIREARISCVVTDEDGEDMDYLRMPNAFVEMLTGRRHWQECYVDEFVRDVRAKATEPLFYPNGVTLRKILNFASDPALGAAEGSKIQMLDGWTEDAFLTEDAVCLISTGIDTRMDEDGNFWVDINRGFGLQMELQVIGTVSGGQGNVIWCPFYLPWSEGDSELFWVDSCSFDIADNERLAECKEAIYEIFVKPGAADSKKSDIFNEEWKFGVLVQEETYLNTLERLQSNLSLLKLLLPTLNVLCVAIGFLTGYLTVRTRVREFAVMRCLGMKRGEIFGRTFGEYFLWAVLGAAIGGGAGLALERAVSSGALVSGGVMLIFFLAGAALSVWRVAGVNVMELMKVEE